MASEGGAGVPGCARPLDRENSIFVRTQTRSNVAEIQKSAAWRYEASSSWKLEANPRGVLCLLPIVDGKASNSVASYRVDASHKSS